MIFCRHSFLLCSLAQSTFLREVKWQLAEVCFVCSHFASEIVMLRMLVTFIVKLQTYCQ